MEELKPSVRYYNSENCRFALYAYSDEPDIIYLSNVFVSKIPDKVSSCFLFRDFFILGFFLYICKRDQKSKNNDSGIFLCQLRQL